MKIKKIKNLQFIFFPRRRVLLINMMNTPTKIATHKKNSHAHAVSHSSSSVLCVYLKINVTVDKMAALTGKARNMVAPKPRVIQW